jgi:hypothetical protein
LRDADGVLFTILYHVELHDNYSIDRFKSTDNSSALDDLSTHSVTMRDGIDQDPRYYDMSEMWGSISPAFNVSPVVWTIFSIALVGVIVWASTLYAHHRFIRNKMKAAHMQMSQTVMDLKENVESTTEAIGGAISKTSSNISQLVTNQSGMETRDRVEPPS